METKRYIILTGGTGQVGSYVARLLQETGYGVIHLIRAENQKSANQRLADLLAYDPFHKSTIRENMDIAIPCDIVEDKSHTIARKVQIIIKQLAKKGIKVELETFLHSAATLKFDEDLSNQTWDANATGTKFALNLTEKLGIKKFAFVSTAYVAGNSKIFFEQDNNAEYYHNPYEKSKSHCEQMIRWWCDASLGRSISIFRLGVVIGDSQTAYTYSFDGFYGFFVYFWLQYRKLSQQRKNSPEVERMFDGDMLNLPMRVKCSDIKLNLVPLEWTGKAIVSLLQRGFENKAYHIVHHSPRQVEWIIKRSLEHLNIRVSWDEDEVFETSYQKDIDGGIEKYEPYVMRGPSFDRSNLEEALGEESYPPEITESLLKRYLDYAIEKGFRKG